MTFLPLHEAQTEMLRWLESLGHLVDYGPERTQGVKDDYYFVWRMCKRKRRFQVVS